MTTINFSPPPTCASFMRSDSFGRIIAGPVGSGKTTACIFELLRRACAQAPAQNGLRYTRFAVVRQTLKQLKDTVLRDIQAWLKELAYYKVSDNTVYVEFGDVRSEWLLIPLETPEDQRRLLSMQLTGAWLSEGIEMPVDLISPLAGRIGRYPSGILGTPTWYGWITDTNMPSEGSPWHQLMTNPPPDVQVWIQPGGMEPDAENLEWLLQNDQTIRLRLDVPEERERRREHGREYYKRFLRSNSEDWCTRYVHAKFGPDPSGTPVFARMFDIHRHATEDELPISFVAPLLVGQDFGRDPCAVICQINERGQLLVLEEVICEDMGLELAVETRLRPALAQQRYVGASIAIIGDPSGRAKGSISEESNFEALKRMGFKAFPAPTNDIDARIRAVEAFLAADKGGKPGLVIDKVRCPKLVTGMLGGYRFGRTKLGIRKPKPDKNEYSHIVDALQYAALAAHGGLSVTIGQHLQRRFQRNPARRITSAAWT